MTTGTLHVMVRLLAPVKNTCIEASAATLRALSASEVPKVLQGIPTSAQSTDRFMQATQVHSRELEKLL